MTQATEIVEVKKATGSAMRFLDIAPEFVLEVASGLREPEDIAAEYGFTPAEWRKLQKYQPFTKAVDDKKAELKLSGYTFRMKAQVLAEDLLDDLALHAKKEDVSFHTILETAKFAARAAGIDSPVQENVGKSGNNFSININLGSGRSVNVAVNTENQQNSVKKPSKRVENDDFEDVQVVYSDDERAVLDELPFDSDRFFSQNTPI